MSQTAQPAQDRVNPFLDLPPAERLPLIAGDYQRAARMYRALAARLRASAVLAGDQRLGDATRQFLGIVHGSGVAYLDGAIESIDAAAARLIAAAQVEPLDLGEPVPVPAPLTGELAPARIAAIAGDYETMAHTLYSLVVRLTDAAEAVGDIALTGDTHPYGDIIYGIVIPYLLQASDALAADAQRLAN